MDHGLVMHLSLNESLVFDKEKQFSEYKVICENTFAKNNFLKQRFF